MPSSNATAHMLSKALASVPPFPGKPRLAMALARMTVHGGTNIVTCSLVDGVELRLDLNDRIEGLMWGHCYERHVQRCLRALLSEGDVFIDIGAHIGYHAVWAATLVGPRGKVFAFEADPGNFARLREHFSPFPWSTAVNKAVWKSSDSAVFERSSEPRESGWGTLTTVRDLKAGEHITVETISLDDWSAESRIEKVSAIKIDAEGSEAGIIQGATNFFKRTKPALIMELNSVVLQQAGTSSQEVARILSEQNFELFSLSDKKLRPLDSRHIPECCEVLALHAERVQAATPRLEECGFRL